MKRVARLAKADLDGGKPVRVAYPPFDVVVARIDGTYLALEDACNHAGASLATGWVERGCIVCPLHGYRFNLITGKLVSPRGLCADQRTFEIKDDGDAIEIWDPFELEVIAT